MEELRSQPFASIKAYGWAAALAWTLFMVGFLFFDERRNQAVALELLKESARTQIDKDVMYRRWNTAAGGVYVKTSEQIKPNPYLTQIKDRDVETTNGMKLTYVNPAYMTRMVHKLNASHGKGYSHITSLNPLNPDNAPDAWESQALLELAKGSPEIAEFISIDQRPQLRLIQPLKVDASCLKCHAQQGYKEGEIRGGISVTVSAAPYIAIARQHTKTDSAGFLACWLVGLAGIWGGSSRILAGDRKIRHQQAELKATIESSTDGIVVIDNQGQITLSNQRFAELWRLPPDLQGRQEAKKLREFVQSQLVSPESFAASLQGIQARPEAESFDVLEFQDGRIYERYSRPQWIGREIVGRVWSFRDITVARKAEAELQKYRDHLEDLVQQRTLELRKANEQAQTANRAKTIFLAQMSHELRTPLTAILGFAELMSRDSTLPNQTRSKLGIILRSGEHLLGLINDILEISKIETGLVKTRYSDADLSQMARDLVEMMRPRAELKHLALVFECHPDFPKVIRTDSKKFCQILSNLVGNAIKFTDTGSITIRLAMQTTATGQAVAVEVHDTGIGLSPNDINQIARPFEQVGERLPEGLGLGLTIARQYVNLLCGELAIESEQGKGSCFRFTIPVDQKADAANARDEALTEPSSPPRTAQEVRLLIAEDQPDNIRLLQTILGAYGFQIRAATNGEQAIAIFQEWRPHVILMDRRMPILNGLEATRRIRRLPGGGGVIIIAVSAHAFSEEREEMLAAGCNEFVGKPFSEEQLLAILRGHLHLHIVPDHKEAADVRPLTIDDLRVLSAEEQKTLKHLALEGDDTELMHWLENQPSLDPKAKAALSTLIRSYRFDLLFELVAPLVPED